jgi:hypothetical protein
MRSALIKLHWVLSSQFGIDPQHFLRSIRGLPLFLRDWVVFRRKHPGKMKFMPCLHDRYAEGGSATGEYFWQDLLVARAIYKSNPIKHVDIGSRVDGFVAHLASFRNCEVFDVRPISTLVPGVIFRQADVMNPASLPITEEGDGYCDSLSCLHAIEHFGLGRYGDPVNPLGYQRGIANMARLLRNGGYLYLSTPIGQERVEFNANWVFDPRRIIRCAEMSGLVIKKLVVIAPSGVPKESALDEAAIDSLASIDYQLGIFTFYKARS